MPNHLMPDEGYALHIWLLGGFRVTAGSHTIPEAAWRLHKARSLVKLLALAPGHRQHREQALELLWPDLEPEAASNNLHHTLHNIRHILEPQLLPHQSSTYLRLQVGILTLCPSALLWTDVEAFRTAGSAARHTQNLTDYQVALALYKGDLLPEDRYEDWVTRRREELHQLYLTLLSELARLHTARHEYSAAITALQQVVTSEPTQEEAHLDLMRLHARIGQRYQALQQYQQLRDALQRELDVAPTAPAQQLYQDIRTGRFPPGQAHPVKLVGSESTSVLGIKSEGATSLASHVGSPDTAFMTALPTNLPNSLTSFIGRATLLSRREREVVLLLAAGRTNREIATDLAISQRTVDTHVSNILAKLELSSRAEIAAWAGEQQLTATPTP